VALFCEEKNAVVVGNDSSEDYCESNTTAKA